MEKKPGNKPGMKRVLVTGPDSTGKSDLVSRLARRFGGVAVEEYARAYVEQLGRPYTYEDVEHIARRQMKQYKQDYDAEWVFFDTWLIITKVWFDEVYGRIPGWIDAQIAQAEFDLVLLCAPDIPWVSDPFRENGGERREALYRRYREELDRFSFDWEIVSGTGTRRAENAEKFIMNRFPDGTF
jgi:NadR type nicotinamide-nucleotide adenylyltransferase